jgi:hypothetical protein
MLFNRSSFFCRSSSFLFVCLMLLRIVEQKWHKRYSKVRKYEYISFLLVL